MKTGLQVNEVMSLTVIFLSFAFNNRELANNVEIKKQYSLLTKVNISSFKTVI